MLKKSECKCKICTEACVRPAHLETGQDWWISKFLKISIEELTKKYLDETPVAVIGIKGKKLVIRALRPKIVNGWCVFFKNGLCTIHKVKPFGCKYANHNTTDEETEEIIQYMTQKWYLDNVIKGKLELFDESNLEQQKEIDSSLNYVLNKVIPMIVVE